MKIKILFLTRIFLLIVIIMTLTKCKKDSVVEPIIPEEPATFVVKITSPLDNSIYHKSTDVPIEFIVLDTNGVKIEYDSLWWKSSFSDFSHSTIYGYGIYANLDPGKQDIICFASKGDEIQSSKVTVTILDSIRIDKINSTDNWDIYRTYCGSIYKLKIDNNNNMVIATIGSGVIIQKNNEWINYDQSDGLISNETQCIGIDIFNNIFIGDGFESGISKFDGEKWSIIPLDESLGGDVHSIIFDTKNTLWLATHRGIIVHDVNGNWETFSQQPTSIRHPGEMVFDNKGNLWGPAEYGGVFKFNKSEWELLKINNEIIRGFFLDIDSDNNLWVGNSSKIYRIGVTDTLEFSYDSTPFPGSINDLKIDNNDILWAATDGGILKYDGTNWETFNTTNSPLLDDVLWRVEIDKENNIWFSSENSIAVFKGN